METKRTITEEERQRMGWASEQERKDAVKEKVSAFLGEESGKYLNEKKSVEIKAKWALHFGMTLKPKEVMENSIDMAYSKVFTKKSLGKSQKSKRAASFNEKERRQNQVYSEIYQYHNIRDKAVNLIAEDNALSETKQAFMEKNDVTGSKYAEATRDVAVFAYLSQQKSMGDLAKKFYRSAASSETEDNAPELLVREMEKIDLSEFEYKSDSEFATGLSVKISKLRAFSHVKAYLREIKLGRIVLTGGPIDLTALNAKMEMLEAIKTDYESRMAMMESPYYVLLAQKDLDGLSKDKLDGMANTDNLELKAYVEAFRTNKANKLFKKSEATAEKEEKIKANLEKQKENADVEADALSDELKELAKEKGLKYETGHKRAGLLTMFFADKYELDGATDVHFYIDKYTHILQDAKLSSSQKKKITGLLTDLNEAATMFDHLQRLEDAVRLNEKGGTEPSMALFRDQGFITLAIQSPAFRKVAERFQAQRDGRALTRYRNHTNNDFTYVISAADKSGLFKNRNDSKNSITRQEVYSNNIELIRYKKEKGIELSGEEKELLGGMEEINEEAVVQKKKELADEAKAKLRVVSDDFLNTDKPFIDVERDWMVLTEKTIIGYRDENGGLYRKDVAGVERMEHHAKFKKGGSGMKNAADADVENLVYGLLMDKQLSFPEMQVEEPLLTALKGYMMFMMIGENAIMRETKKGDLLKSKVKELSEIVSKIKKEEEKKRKKAGLPEDAEREKTPQEIELDDLRKELEQQEKRVVRIQAFSFRYKISVPISLAYLPNVLKLQSYADARQIVMQEEDGAYREQLLKTIDEKEAALKKEVEVNKESAYKTTKNGVPIEVTENQKIMIKNLSTSFDVFTELRRKKAEGDGTDDESIRADALKEMEKAMQTVMDYNKLDEA